MSLAGLIPFFAFLITFLALGNRWPELGWRRAFLRAAVLWGAAAVVLTKILSLSAAVRPSYLLAGWMALTTLVAIDLARTLRERGSLDLPSFVWPQDVPARVALVAVLMVVVITGLVAWIAPPNTWDSLNYHMSRVAHWAQLGAVRHYATGIEVQNNMPPGAELLVLNFYVLAGSDRLANLVQWFAMIVSLFGVAQLAGQLGAQPRGRWLAVVFAATLPMGIVQASSTMTDYVVGMWALAGAVEALAIWTAGDDRRGAAAYFGLAAGLAILAKPTAFAYLAPLALMAGLGLARRSDTRMAVRSVMAMGGLALALNLGHFARNLATYGHPISPTSRIAEHRSPLLGGRALISNLLRNAALHAGTPSPHINKALALAVHGVHNLMRLDVNDPRTTATGEFKVGLPTTNENRAGNPLHFWLSLPLFGLVLLRPRYRALRSYAVAAALTFVAFSLLFKWQAFGSRYHLPFFLLVAPLFGTVMGSLLRRSLRLALIVGLFAACLPWLLGIDSRPVLPRPDQPSVVSASRPELYFTNAPYLQRPYREMTTLLQAAQCHDIGISMVGGGLEYPLWALLGAPDADLRLEWLVAGTPSEIYRDPSYQPCAVICQHCTESEIYAGLPLAYERTEFRLFMDTSD